MILLTKMLVIFYATTVGWHLFGSRRPPSGSGVLKLVLVELAVQTSLVEAVSSPTCLMLVPHHADPCCHTTLVMMNLNGQRALYSAVLRSCSCWCEMVFLPRHSSRQQPLLRKIWPLLFGVHLVSLQHRLQSASSAYPVVCVSRRAATGLVSQGLLAHCLLLLDLLLQLLTIGSTTTAKQRSRSIFLLLGLFGHLCELEGLSARKFA